MFSPQHFDVRFFRRLLLENVPSQRNNFFYG